MNPSNILLPVNLLFGGLLGIVLTWLLTSATTRWRRGRGLIRTPRKVRLENERRLREAHSDRAQGWRELGRALMQFALLLLVVGLAVVALVG